MCQIATKERIPPEVELLEEYVLGSSLVIRGERCASELPAENVVDEGAKPRVSVLYFHPCGKLSEPSFAGDRRRMSSTHEDVLCCLKDGEAVWAAVIKMRVHLVLLPVGWQPRGVEEFADASLVLGGKGVHRRREWLPRDRIALSLLPSIPFV